MTAFVTTGQSWLLAKRIVKHEQPTDRDFQIMKCNSFSEVKYHQCVCSREQEVLKHLLILESRNVSLYPTSLRPALTYEESSKFVNYISSIFTTASCQEREKVKCHSLCTISSVWRIAQMFTDAPFAVVLKSFFSVLLDFDGASKINYYSVRVKTPLP